MVVKTLRRKYCCDCDAKHEVHTGSQIFYLCRLDKRNPYRTYWTQCNIEETKKC